MTSTPILPPANPNDDPPLDELVAMAHAAQPSIGDDDFYGALDLSSWTPPPPSVMTHVPPPPPGRALRIGAIASVATAALAVSVATVVTWSRISDAAEGSVELRAVAAEPLRAALPGASVPITRPAFAAVAVAVARPAPASATVLREPAAPTVLAASTMAVRVDRRARTRAVEPRSIAAATAPVPEPAPTPTAGQISETPAAAPVVAAPDPALPDVPERESVIAAIDGVRPMLQSCAAARHGAALAHITVAGSGRVTHAIVSGAFAGTPEGSCIARAIRGAQFPAFAQAKIELSYPFAF